MYFSRFTQKSKKVIELSLECAREFGHNRVDSEHLLLGLSKEGDGVASRVLLKLGITPKYIEGKIIEKKGIIPISSTISKSSKYTPTNIIIGSCFKCTIFNKSITICIRCRC